MIQRVSNQRVLKFERRFLFWLLSRTSRTTPPKTTSFFWADWFWEVLEAFSQIICGEVLGTCLEGFLTEIELHSSRGVVRGWKLIWNQWHPPHGVFLGNDFHQPWSESDFAALGISLSYVGGIFLTWAISHLGRLRKGLIRTSPLNR